VVAANATLQPTRLLTALALDPLQPTVQTGTSVQVSGHATIGNNQPFANVEVQIQYSNDASRWNIAATSTTRPDGTFSANWAPTSQGHFYVRAALANNTRYPSTNSSLTEIVSGQWSLSKRIVWTDGSTEQVDLSHGYFFLNGHEKHLLGFVFGNLAWQWWKDPSKFALVDRELTYLEGAGVRIIEINFGWGDKVYPLRDTQWTRALDLFYNHKMLVALECNDHYSTPDENDPTGFTGAIDREIRPGYHYSKWWQDFWSLTKNYPNVVAFSLEDELDGDDRFTASQMKTYMTWLTGLVSDLTKLQVYCKFWPYIGEPATAERKLAILSTTNLAVCDPYAVDKSALDGKLTTWSNFLTQNQYSGIGWWTGEIGAIDSSGNVIASMFTVDFIDSAFTHGSSVVFLYAMHWTPDTRIAFFDTNGNPIQSAANVLSQSERLQANI